MKYKVKIKCPGFDKDEIIIANEDGTHYDDVSNNYYYLKHFPEIFEPIEEILFTTFDEVDIYKGDGYWLVEENFEPEYKIANLVFKWYEVNKGNYTDYCFSSKENAESWIKENKPMFSTKQIIDAAKKVEFAKQIGYTYFVNELKKELGI